MPKKFIYLLTASSIIAASSFSYAGGPGTRSAHIQPVIEKIETDTTNNQILISGSQFGISKPIVNLGSTRLEVIQSTGNLITAKLPKDIRPATYRIDVISTEKIGNTSLYLNIPG